MRLDEALDDLEIAHRRISEFQDTALRGMLLVKIESARALVVQAREVLG
jgi:hypothetical protein